MKKIILLGSFVAGLALTSCDDFLNDNRYPLSSQTSSPEYWSSATNVQNQVNYLYETFSGYGNGAGSGTFYYSTLSDDQCGRNTFTHWTDNGTVPTSSTSWSTPYTYIRSCNQIIQGVSGGDLNGTNSGNNFIGIARLMRAYQYYKLVRAYGDVPLIDFVPDPEDVYGPRDPRNEVMNFVLEDLNFAVANISSSGTNMATFSPDMAQAMKAEICLFEGTYAKYHQNDNSRATQFLQEAVKAGEAIYQKYPIGNDYHSLYNSWISDILNNSEVIFAKLYSDTGGLMNSIQDYSSASDGIAGITKDAFDSYLFLDGLPASKTTYNNTDLGEWSVDADGNINLDISNLLEVRDQRLSATTYPNVFYRTTKDDGSDWLLHKYENTADMWSITGYGVYKFNDLSMPGILTNTNKVCAPLFWGARLYLAIAEAKAELGTLTDNDVANFLNPLYARAGLPAQTVSGLNGINDPANNMGVSSLIWEIRRCRRCELIMDDDIRYWDLVRWKQLEKLSNVLYPEIMMGANIGDNPLVDPGNSFKTDKGNYINATYGESRDWNEKYYFYPIPSGQITLNPQLTQNPGW